MVGADGTTRKGTDVQKEGGLEGHEVDLGRYPQYRSIPHPLVEGSG